MLAKSGNVDFTKQLFQDSSSEVWIYTENQTLESPNRNIKVICIDKCYLKDILKDIYKRADWFIINRSWSSYNFQISSN